jgi:hypothetical protein
METAFVITPHVINTINALPTEERVAITSALAGELILGADAVSSLTPVQAMLYSMIKQYVCHDTSRFNSLTSHSA